jgi:hypothetical protein
MPTFLSLKVINGIGYGSAEISTSSTPTITTALHVLTCIGSCVRVKRSITATAMGSTTGAKIYDQPHTDSTWPINGNRYDRPPLALKASLGIVKVSDGRLT